ncbi:MAG: PadR family transcriptional regulator [Candidatus Dormibacteraceae bacterium]
MDSNELLLLGLLDQQDMHGYKLHELLEHQLHFISDLKRSTAYRLLEDLLRRGLVERESEREGRRPERMVYHITPAGQARFQKLLREQLASAQPVFHSGNVALLFSDRIPRDERLALLDRRQAGVAEQRQVMASVVAAHSAGTAVRLTMEHDLAHLETEVAWLSSIITGLKEGKES